jgi:hypothetical protein
MLSEFVKSGRVLKKRPQPIYRPSRNLFEKVTDEKDLTTGRSRYQLISSAPLPAFFAARCVSALN